MKFAYLILLVQALLLGGLYLKLVSLESRLDSVSRPLADAPANNAIEEADEPAAQETQGGIDTGELRRVIREELRALAPLLAVQQGEAPAQGNDRQYDDADMEYRRTLIIQEMEYLKQEEQVSTADLDRLIGEIALLDPDRRSELMKMLNAAINKGEIRGHL